MTFLKTSLPLAAAFCLTISVPVLADKANSPTVLGGPAASGAEHLSGELAMGGHRAGKGAKASSELVLHVHTHHGKTAGDPAAKHGKTVELSASGEVLTKLQALAGHHAHVKVSGSLSGNTMVVTEVSEAAHHHRK